jgi:hypothetical protein
LLKSILAKYFSACFIQAGTFSELFVYSSVTRDLYFWKARVIDQDKQTTIEEMKITFGKSASALSISCFFASKEERGASVGLALTMHLLIRRLSILILGHRFVLGC